jgi:hypothetical protein
VSHAGLWNGTAASFIDLHKLLPAGYSESTANGVWTDGQIIQIVGSAYNAAAMREEAIVWNGDLVPDPPTVSVIGKKRRVTSRRSLVIRGGASDADGDLQGVQVKAGQRPYRAAQGAPDRWKFTLRLWPGVTKVGVRAVDAAGAFSPTVRLTIVRR